MNCKPILFNTDMVRAILAGQKTQTRRVIKPQPRMILSYIACSSERRLAGKWHYPPESAWKMWDDERYKLPADFSEEEKARSWNPPVKTDDALWVRETWSKDANRYLYRADYGENERFYMNGREIAMHWHPSIHMPKEAARIFLLVKRVWVECLREISVENCAAEGIWDDYKTSSEKYHENLKKAAYPKVFSELWDSTIKKDDLPEYGWNANPWVWAIEFERCEKPEGWN